MRVNDSIDRDDVVAAAEAALSFKGPGNVLVCWEHKQLANIAVALGTQKYAKGSGWSGPVAYPDDRFDLIWVVPPPWKEVREVKSEKVAGLDDGIVVGPQGDVAQPSGA